MATKEVLEQHQEELRSLKKDFPAGPWMHEPDRIDFKHRGFDCLALRNQWGAWCGYVALKPDHKFYGKPYHEIEVQVHGGLTYSDKCAGAICHVTDAEDDVWWLGFDCGHGGDLVPRMQKETLMHDYRRFVTYRDVEYITNEIKTLVDRLEVV